MDHDWLWDRGGLHDARIVSVTFQDGGLVLALTDEWANENDNRASASPGELILEGVAADATITSLEGGGSARSSSPTGCCGWPSATEMRSSSGRRP